MCGRFTLRTNAAEVAKAFDVMLPDQILLRFNIAPTQNVLALRRSGAHIKPVWLRWGLIPFWAKDAKFADNTINARAETLAEKPAFRHTLRRQRCAILADGFYEWRQINSRTKEPVYFTLHDDSPFAFAGLWDRWNAPDGSLIESGTIITTTANDIVAPFHHRMPVILTPERVPEWLNPALESLDDLLPLLAPLPSEWLKSQPVSPVINSPRHDVDPRQPKPHVEL